MYNAIRFNKTIGSIVNLGSYAEIADAMNAIKADYVNTLFSSIDAHAFMCSTGCDSLKMEYATYITACDGGIDLAWCVERA